MRVRVRGVRVRERVLHRAQMTQTQKLRGRAGPGSRRVPARPLAAGERALTAVQK